MRGRSRIVLGKDPPPDLALEIEISRSALDRMEIYARLGVPEVWRYSGRRLRVLLLKRDGSYRESRRGLSFPFLDARELLPFLEHKPGEDENARLRRFVEWLRQQDYCPERK